ncbi:unnamed protein product, partial [Cylicostephanus goldi]
MRSMKSMRIPPHVRHLPKLPPELPPPQPSEELLQCFEFNLLLFLSSVTTFPSFLMWSKYHLDTLTTNDSQAFRRIDAQTLCQLMKSMSSEEFAE